MVKKNPPPKKGSYARDSSNRSNTTGKSSGGYIGGSITRKVWNFITGWDNVGRRE